MQKTVEHEVVPFWRNEHIRSIIFQVLVVSFIAFAFYFLYSNMQTNMEKRGIATGFAFLSNPAGFDIFFSPLVNYALGSTYLDVFWVGLSNTLLVSVVGIVFATLLGVLVGVARLSQNWLVRQVSSVYIELFRNTPLLLQIFFWYAIVVDTMPSVKQSYSLFGEFFINNRGIYAPAPIFGEGFGLVMAALIFAIALVMWLSRWNKKRQELTGQVMNVWVYGTFIIIGLPLVTFFAVGAPLSFDYPILGRFNLKGGMNLIPEFVALSVALVMYTAAFIAEIIRAGIQAVPHGQTEAAMSLDLSRSQTLRLVIFPQAFRIIIPPLTLQYLNLMKNSSLAVAIGYPDLVAVFAGTALNQVGQAVEMMGMTMAVYLTLSILISIFMNWYNKKVALVER